MAQADGVVANGTGSAVRSDINNQYAALWSNHSGSTEPSSGKVAYQFWADTNTSILKIRNSANNAWINLFTLAGGIDVDAASIFNEDVTFTGASYNLVWDKSDNALEFADNGKCTFGGESDLSLYHDGNDSYIKDSGTGNLKILANSLEFKSAGDGEHTAKFTTNGSCELYYNNSKKLSTTDYGLDTKTIKPDADNSHDLGASDQRWDDVYATNGTIQTSDRNAKKDIVKSDLGLTFINAVEPVSYKFKTGTRTHYGVIAQDLETVLDGKDFAGLTKDTETGNYGVRYSELISPLIKAIQELSTEVETLKTKVAAF